MDRRAPERMAIDDLVIAGPPGYCIDRRASEVRRDGGAILLLGPCALVSGNPDALVPEVSGILTATVSDGAEGEAEFAAMLGDLNEFFQTEAGLAALSLSGDPATVELLDSQIEEDTLYIHARDTAAPTSGLTEDSWRTLFGIGDRLLTVSISGLAGAPIDESAAISTLDAFADRIRAETLAAETAG